MASKVTSAMLEDLELNLLNAYNRMLQGDEIPGSTLKEVRDYLKENLGKVDVDDKTATELLDDLPFPDNVTSFNR